MTKRYSQMHRTDKYSEQSSIIRPAWPNGWVFIFEPSGSGFKSSCSHLNLRISRLLRAWSSLTFRLLECVYSLWKRVRDMPRTYSQMHRTDKYSEQLNHLVSLAKWLSVHLQTKWFWVRVQLLHLNFRFCACFEQGPPWHSGNYRVWIHPENAHVTCQGRTVNWFSDHFT